MQFGFSPGKGTTDAIFIVRQLQKKYLAKKKDLRIAFIDLEKAFDRVPREVLWWALREVKVEEWLIKVIQSLYEGATTSVKLRICIFSSLVANSQTHQLQNCIHYF